MNSALLLLQFFLYSNFLLFHHYLRLSILFRSIAQHEDCLIEMLRNLMYPNAV